MTRVTNTRSTGPIGIGGALIEPQKSVDLELSDEQLEELKAHPFVKEGWIRIESPARESVSQSEPTNARDLVEAIADMEDVERLEELTEDPRKTVREAAEARLEELEPADDGSEESTGSSGEE